MPTTHVDKLIIAYLPVVGGTAWQQLCRVPLQDMLVFADTFPGFYRDSSPLPPYSVPPPSPPLPPQAFWDVTTPPPPPTPQYSPASPDGYSPGGGGGMTSFPPYYSPSSPGIVTFPPTPNLPPPCSTPNAPSTPHSSMPSSGKRSIVRRGAGIHLWRLSSWSWSWFPDNICLNRGGGVGGDGCAAVETGTDR